MSLPVVVITGAACGIEQAVVKRFAAECFGVVGVDVDPNVKSVAWTNRRDTYGFIVACL